MTPRAEIDMSDANATKAMRGFIREARESRIHSAIERLGLDEAERLLGLKGEKT